MKYLMILPSALRGGVEEYSLTITSAAVETGWDVHVALPRSDQTVSLIHDFKDKGVQYHQLKIIERSDWQKYSKRDDLLRLMRTVALLLKLQPDVVQIVLPWPDKCFGSILACGLLRVPTLVRFGLVPYQFAFKQKRLKAYAWARARNQQWMTISENNRQLVCDSFQIPEEQVLCIYNGPKLPTALGNPDSKKMVQLRLEVRQELGLPTNTRIALTVGRLCDQKGYVDLIPTIPHLAKEFPDVKFVWVGDGEQREQLDKMVYSYGITEQVLFLGYRSDVSRLLQAADLFVFPTRFEGGQSFAIAEAMAHGLPIVSSDASGIPEVIQHQAHGLLFRTGDSCDLLETLRWALRHPVELQQMAQNALLRAHEFTEQRMIKQTLQVLQQLSFASKPSHHLPQVIS